MMHLWQPHLTCQRTSLTSANLPALNLKLRVLSIYMLLQIYKVSFRAISKLCSGYNEADEWRLVWLMGGVQLFSFHPLKPFFSWSECFKYLLYLCLCCLSLFIINHNQQVGQHDDLCGSSDHIAEWRTIDFWAVFIKEFCLLACLDVQNILLEFVGLQWW